VHVVLERSLVAAAAAAAAPAGLLLSCIQDPDPCIFFEPKML
jgi:pyruvate/2-oxoglutarate/acetoin dehydrogenase E1 component